MHHRLFGDILQWHRRITLSDREIRRIIIVLSALNFLFVLCSQNAPRTDQRHILECATEIWQGNYEGFYPGNYMDLYPHQNGIVLFAYILCIIGGGYNFLLFQFLNALMVNCTYYQLYRFWKKYGEQIRGDEILIGIGMFFPIMLTINYVYGTIIGLAFSVWAILYQQAYLKDRKKRDLVLSIVFVSLACVFKSNFIIFLIGVVVVYLYDVAIHRMKGSIAGVAGILLCSILLNGMVDKSLSMITDGASDNVQGIPTTAWVVMSLQDSQRSGWYTGYSYGVYENNDFDAGRARQECLGDLKTVIEQRMNDPKGTIDFFHRKITGLWSEASFGGFYNSRMDYQTILQGHNAIYNDAFAYTGKLHRILGLFLETYQSIVYLGVALYLWYHRKNRNLAALSGIIIFLGGFVFQLFWEIKSSYGFIYFVILIPYAITGFGKCLDHISNREKTILIKNIGAVSVMGIALVTAGSLLALNEDTGGWDTYLREHRFISDGYYYLKPIGYEGACKYDESGKVYIVGNESEEKEKLYLTLDTSDTWLYQFDNISRERRLIVVKDNIYMLSNEEIDYPSDYFWYWRWRIERLGGGYCVRWWNDMNKVITFDEETMTVYLSDYEEGKRAQIWELSKR